MSPKCGLILDDKVIGQTINESIFFKPTCDIELINIINKMKANKSAANDGITPKILKITLPLHK